MGTLLQKINSPEDLKKLPKSRLPQVAEELRRTILEVVSTNGGHLGAALGAVELTVALHYVFDAPKDTLVWDVGHQVHAHKILTGRRDAFKTFRQYKGLSGFSNKDESVYDPFTTGHGGTSISTALGIAVAHRLLQEERKVIAIIGDASLVSGMAFEGLNHAGHLKNNLIVILNDNEMSISPTVGAISRHLNRILTNPFYNHIRKDVENLIRRVPKVGGRMVRYAKKIDEGLKNLLVPGLLFEEMGFRYFGPIDGHNFDDLLRIFGNVSRINGPLLLHVITKKGKGYEIAESNPEKWHASVPFDVETGAPKQVSASVTYTKVFGQTAIELASRNPHVAAITAAMCDGTGLVDFSKKFPERFFDVGIAEEHGVAFASGLAKTGIRPLVAIYSTFLQRAHDQIIHDVALQNTPVIFCMDRGGLVGEDGPTHHGVFDIAFFRKVPGITFLAPRDGRELKMMLSFAVAHTEGPVALRYPRGAVAEETGGGLASEDPAPLVKGRAELLRRGTDVLFLALGSMVYPAYECARALEAEGVSAAVVNARFVKPLDEEMILEQARDKRLIVTLEEGALAGGFGEAVMAVIEQNKETKVYLRDIPVRALGVPDRFIDHGKREVLLDTLGLSVQKIKEEVLRFVGYVRVPSAPGGVQAVKIHGKSIH